MLIRVKCVCWSMEELWNTACSWRTFARGWKRHVANSVSIEMARNQTISALSPWIRAHRPIVSLPI
jgi:hypothetical protein